MAPHCHAAFVSSPPERPTGKKGRQEPTNPKGLLVLGDPRSTPHVPPAIFLASLTDYVNGIIHGRWVPARAPVGALQQALVDVLASSVWAARTGEPAEEWIILDHEGFPGVGPDAYEALPDVAALAGWSGDNEEAPW